MTFTYRLRKLNIRADALSRKEEDILVDNLDERV
jgi:hypothetical protein